MVETELRTQKWLPGIRCCASLNKTARDIESQAVNTINCESVNYRLVTDTQVIADIAHTVGVARHLDCQIALRT